MLFAIWIWNIFLFAPLSAIHFIATVSAPVFQNLYRFSATEWEADGITYLVEFAKGVNHMDQEMTWLRALAAGSLVAGAALLLNGRKKAALTASGLGAAVILAEDPEAMKELWQRVPDYLQDGHEMLGRLEGVLDGITEQGSRVRQLVRRA